MAENFHTINEKLSKLRQNFARFILSKSIIRVLILLIIAFFALAVVEGFRYLDSEVREIILFLYIGLGITFLAIPFVYYILIRKNKIHKFNDYQLAKMIGKKYEDIRDSLFNVLQLQKMSERESKGFSNALILQSIKKIAEEIEPYSFEDVIPCYELKKSVRSLLLVLLCIVVFFVISPQFYISATERLLHPEKDYPIPLPFTISSISGSFGILGSDSTNILLSVKGKKPDNINLSLVYPDFSRTEVITVGPSDTVKFSLKSVKENIIYEGFVENHSPFRPWRRISSGFDTISVINRPEIISVEAVINYPNYTGMKPEVQKSNNTDFYVIPGTVLKLRANSNKELSAGYLRFKNINKVPLSINNTTAYAEIYITQNDQFEIFVEDKNGVSNINPIKYNIRIYPDTYPMITLLSPTGDIDLTENMEIPLGIRISDDFGFSKATISYRLIKKYSESSLEEFETIFPLYDTQLTLQELYYTWDVSNLGLGPEDAVEFKINIYDNDEINGPKKSSTKSVAARFPSLNDLFVGINQQQNEIYESGEEILSQLESTKEILEEISLELLKDPNITWEQKTQLEQEIKKTKQAGEKLSELANEIEGIIRSSEENQLFTKETLEKFIKLQEAFQNIMTPELEEAMQKLQEALEKMDPDEVQKALKNFSISQEQFAQELDRMLEIFERVKIEQSVDELVKRLEDLSRRQEILNKELNDTNSDDIGKMEKLAEEEKSIYNDTKILEDLMERTKKDMSQFPLMPDEQLQEISEQMQEMGLLEDLKNSHESLERGEKLNAQQSSQRAQLNLSALAKMMQNFRQEFNKQSMEEVLTDFRKVMNKTLQISKEQEELSTNVRNIPRQSDQIIDTAIEQQRIQENLSKIIQDLIALSTKTFAISPRIGQQLGKASVSMRESISQMEERNPQKAAQLSSQATVALNMTAMELMSAMNEIEQSGSPSGFENYIEQLQNMAGQQQGINDETQLLAIGPNSNPTAALKELAARQQQVKKSLEQLQKEIMESTKQSGSSLEGIAKDMEEVINDLKNNRILQRTIERQQRILSRLLDAQKSLRTQGYEEKRRSQTGENIVKESPSSLPRNLGEKQSYLRKNLEKALQEGYSKEYENIIRQYFELLSKEGTE